jgi:hypothetical protein
MNIVSRVYADLASTAAPWGDYATIASDFSINIKPLSAETSTVMLAGVERYKSASAGTTTPPRTGA